MKRLRESLKDPRRWTTPYWPVKIQGIAWITGILAYYIGKTVYSGDPILPYQAFIGVLGVFHIFMMADGLKWMFFDLKSRKTS